jgi:hypothetical protein
MLEGLTGGVAAEPARVRIGALEGDGTIAIRRARAR